MKEYTASQLAGIIGISVSSVYHFAKHGLLNYRQIPTRNNKTFPIQWNYENIRRIRSEIERQKNSKNHIGVR